MGDGRHRQDPGGHRRYLVAALGVLLVLGLLVTGGYALYSVLTGEADVGTSASPSASASTGVTAQRASALRHPPTPSTARQPTLALEITGARCYVSVHLPDGKMLLNETLRRGEHARFYQPRLRVTVGKAQAVRIAVNGESRESGTKGIDTFTVSQSD